jgi:hypothetical protein
MINSSMESTKMNMQVKTGGGILALPPTIVGQLPDGRLTYQQLKVDKQITVQLADVDDKGPNGSVKIELHVFPKGANPDLNEPTYVVLTKFKDEQPGGDWTFPIDFVIDTTALIDRFDTNGEYAPYEMAFIIYDFFENPDSSLLAEFLVDLTAPYQPQPGRGNGTGTRPTSVALTGVPAVIDDAWLSEPANAGGLNLTIPTGYRKFEAGNDKANFYLSVQTTFPLMQGEGAAVSDFPLPVGGVINIPLTYLSALAEGAYFSSYNLTDLAGNISNNANITNAFRRVKTPAPVLAPPTILGRTPITFVSLTAPNKVTIEVLRPLHWLPLDRIILYITSDKAGAPILVAEQSIPDTGTGPLLFDVLYDIWAQVFGDANGAEEVECECWYELGRTTIPVNPVSPSIFDVLILSYAGPEQPNLPDLENPNLLPVVIQGAGTPPPNRNTLGPAQAGNAAAMNWPVWTDPNRPVTGREIVKFYYQGKLVGGPIPVRAGDTTVTTSLPWATILAEGNGTGANAREAYVTIEYPSSDNVMKQQTTTKVDVTAIVINLPVALIIVSSFQTATTVVPERVVTSINCPSLNHPTVANGAMPPYQPRQLRIRIRRDINIPTGAMVNLDFEGRTTNAVGAPAIAGTQITASLPMPATGDLEFRLTNYTAIRTIQLPSTVPGQRPATRYARIAYTVNGVVSETVVPVALLNSSLVYCEQERPETP